jgi:hypothetical protein
MRLPRFSRERATRLFDGCQAALVWLAVLAFVALCPALAPEPRPGNPKEDEPHVP